MWLAEPNKTHDTAHHAPNAEISPAKSATMRTFLGAMSKPFLGFFYAHHFASRHDEPGSLIPADNTLNNIGSRGIMLGQSTGIQFLQPGKTYESYNSIIKNNVITNDQSACLSESSSYDAEIYNNSCYNAAIVHHGAIFISNESALQQAGTNVYIRNNIIEDSSSLPMLFNVLSANVISVAFPLQ